MKITDDPQFPFKCECCHEVFYYQSECEEHEAACGDWLVDGYGEPVYSEHELEGRLDGFQIEGDDDDQI